MISAQDEAQVPHSKLAPNNESLKSKVRRLESEIKQLQTTLAKHKSISAQVVTTLKKELYEKDELISDLQSKSEPLPSVVSNDHIESALKAEADSHVRDQANLISTLKLELEQAQEQIKALQAQVDRDTQDLKDLKSTKTELLQTVSTLSAESAALRADIQSKDAMLQQSTEMIRSRDTRLHEALVEMDNFRGLLVAANNHVSEVDATVAKWEEKVQAIKLERDEMENQLKASWANPWANLLKSSFVGGGIIAEDAGICIAVLICERHNCPSRLENLT
ncbi:hypothetical protein HDV05_003133 [Chytridiales sp. JEL 0842]|nr:hypothetical protein HDV05_003133 [Chytridiales sp. JEL 0842]